MRQMSFSLTTPQVIARKKRVTRRIGWLDARVGERISAVEKAMGLRLGEKVNRLAVIVVTAVDREELRDIVIHEGDVELEGFPGMSEHDFIAMFCRHHSVRRRRCTPATIVTRIAFDYVDEPETASGAGLLPFA